MADQKLSQLTELGSAPATSDLLYLDHSGTSNSLTVAHLFTSPTLVTPTLGVATVTSVNGNTVPSTSDTVALLAATQTFTNKTLTSPALTTPAETGIGTADLFAPNNHAVTVSSNAGTCSQSFLINTFTNSSAATMAITLGVTTPTPKDGQFMVVRIYDFSATAETIGWTNTENSTVSVPTTSNGSTTLPLSVCFMYNAATSKWRCVASA